MAPLDRLKPCCHHALGVAGLLTLGLLSPPTAPAQIAEVVRPDAQGDFTSIRIPAGRGKIAQLFWLVVDRDPRGLLCRDEQGRAWIALRYGAVVALDQPEQQLTPLLLNGKPYVRLSVKPMDLLVDVRFRQRGQAAVCRVRANSAFLAPIQMESMQQALIRP